MLNITELSKDILQNKINRNFPTDDLNHEFKLFKDEVKEAEESIKDSAKFGKELADLVIYAISMARITGVDLEKEVNEKVEYNKTRTHKKGTFTLKEDDLYENNYDEIKILVESDFFKKDNHSLCLLHRKF